MPTVQATLADDTRIEIPEWICDNASFLRWAESSDAPEKGKIGYHNGIVWIGQPMEQLFHNEIKAAVASAIMLWARQQGLGKFITDGMLYSHLESEFTTVPDGIFVTKASIANGTVQLGKGRRSTKLTGSPDIVVEVVSRSSAKKDLIELRNLYHQAGIREYWLIDSREDEPELVILEWTKRAYRTAASQAGWGKSKVLGGSFRVVVKEAEVWVEGK